MKTLLMSFLLMGGCATDPAAAMRRATCSALCAEALGSMSMSYPVSGNGCTCWSPLAPREPPRPTVANIRIYRGDEQ